MNEEILDVRGALRILRRYRRILIVATLAGALVGAAFAVLRPPPAVSTALVLLPPPPPDGSGQGGRDTGTQVAIATTTPVLSTAAAHVTPHPQLRVLHAATHAHPVTNEVVQVTVSDPDSRRARALTQAVVTAYVAYLNQTAAQTYNGALGGLQSTARSLNQKIAQIQGEVRAAKRRLAVEPAGTAAARRDETLVASLRSAQAELSTQARNVDAQVRQLSSTQGLPEGTAARLLQPAAPPTRGTFSHTVISVVEFCCLFLILTAFTILTVARRDRRLRSRDEIADAVGRSVVASVAARPQRSVANWQSLLATYRPSTVDNWTLRKLLHQLGVGDDRSRSPRSVTVISIAGDNAALAAGPQLAAFAANAGVPVALALAGYHTSAAALWAACGPSSPNANSLHPNLRVREPSAAPAKDVELTVVVVVVDRESPQLGGLRETPATLFAVSTGFPEPDDIARLAVACDDASRTLDGVIVVNPDSRDRTTGFYPGHQPVVRSIVPTQITGVVPGARP